MTDIQRIEELTEILNIEAQAYYQGNTTNITDKEYDALYDELAALEQKAGYRLPNSPTSKVGHEVVSELQKVVHRYPMMSLDKTKDENKLTEFLGDQNGILSWKLDGLAVELTYDHGKLEMAVTRGNGLIGENITHNAKNFVNIPQKIDYNKETRIRGEAVITFDDFRKINDSISENENSDEAAKYKNPRNLCAGTVRQLDNSVSKTRNVRFYAYSLADEDGHGLKTRREVLEFLIRLGFQTVTFKAVSKDNFGQAFKEFKESVAGTEYATDGLVLALDDIAYGKSLGVTAKFPKDSIAFKWADEEAETVLIDVEWNTSRTGLINPVAVFEPVEIEGTTVERASLHNLSIFEGLSLGKGDRLLVYKANMIIPQVASNLDRSGGLDYPKSCPVCGNVTETEVNKDAGFLYCVNPNCAARAVQTIVHYVSRDAMNVDGLSEQTIARFHELGYLKDYADLYDLPKHTEIAELKGFGKTSFSNLVESLERSKTCRLHSFIHGLGIRNIGLSYAKSLCRFYKDDLDKIRAAEPEELSMLYGFGEAIAKSIRDYFSNPSNIEIMERALAHLTFIKDDEEGEPFERKLEGKVAVITGDLKAFKNRKELQELIERHGGRVTGSVSSRTHYLINNDAASGSSKNQKARELGIPVVTEEEFIELLNK